ncbi:hypothetical protein EKG83_21025 [Saccharothrix syringae]|uniref:Integrase catalytic domain-containing protein n=1 Tax=Saccharothrix syringae TaxID=103733 RepID=A0A5Q0H171_SACSY|nr:hypothetical protein EKG83_21025 [Saccharothrix syringae]
MLHHHLNGTPVRQDRQDPSVSGVQHPGSSPALQGAQTWSSARETRLAAFGWLHRYNTRRRHSHLGQTSPIDYENSLLPTSATLTHAA